MIKPLSPNAQAVLDTALDAEFCIEFSDLEATMKASVQRVVAAALQAAADQVVPERDMPLQRCFGEDGTYADWNARDDVRNDLLSIADELEGSNG